MCLLWCCCGFLDLGTLLSSCFSCFSKLPNPKSTNLCAGSLDGAPIHTTVKSRLSKYHTALRSRNRHLDASDVFTDCSAIATATRTVAALLLFEAIPVPLFTGLRTVQSWCLSQHSTAICRVRRPLEVMARAHSLLTPTHSLLQVRGVRGKIWPKGWGGYAVWRHPLIHTLHLLLLIWLRWLFLMTVQHRSLSPRGRSLLPL